MNSPQKERRMNVWINGQIVPRQQARLSVYDHATLYGDGVFEGIRAYHGRVFQCGAHLDRLFASAEAIRLEIPYTRDELAEAMYETLESNGLTDGYIRLVVTRGDGTLGLNPFRCPTPQVFIIADQIALYSEKLYREGMPVIIANTRRTAAGMLNPRIKSLNYLNNIFAKIECIDAGVEEALMRNAEGDIAEATGDNIFIVEGGELVTPPPEAGILLGITRSVVLHLAEKMDIPSKQETIPPQRLLEADECFLTGTAAEVIAVTHVDGKAIGDGKAGPVTDALLKAFREFARSGEELPYLEG
jgi:branched-chain amino acid aminotransferase